MLCFVHVLHGCVLYVCCYVGKNVLLQCLQFLRGGIWASTRCPCLCLCWVFWDMDYVSQLPCVRYYLFVKSSFNILVRNVQQKSKKTYVFRYLIFSLSGPCECYFCFVLLPLGPDKWCVIVHIMSSGKSLQLLWYVVLVCYQYGVCENYIGSVYIGGYGGLSESGPCVFRELCPVSFLVVGECPSVLL